MENNKKKTPFNGKEEFNKICQNYTTPFYLYIEKDIKINAVNFLKSFSWNPGFKEFFAVKACPNPSIIKILKELGLGVDCSSLTELILCEKIGFKGENIMFTSSGASKAEYLKAFELGAIINIDYYAQIEVLEALFGKLPETLCFRYNPGEFPDAEGKNLNILGSPKESKFGMTKEQIILSYDLAQRKGVENFGVHMMIASNILDVGYFEKTSKMLFSLIIELKQKLNIKTNFANMGGGIGINYKPGENAVDYQEISQKIENQFNEILIPAGFTKEFRLFMEAGRVIIGPYGYLITKVLYKKTTYKNYIQVDACMADLMRPGMYQAYHHISVLGKENEKPVEKYDIVGSLCENNDKFAIDRLLPAVEIDDILLIHDAGAHGHAMGFNYNGKLRCAELLLQENGGIQLIRRAQTIEDYFATLDI